MPGTYTQLLYHIVFSTKYRKPWIAPSVAERLDPFIGGIVRAEHGTLLAIGGIEDHVHLYIRWRTDETIANLMRTVKARSSKWIHDTFPELAEFAWQEGYAAFTVSQSQDLALRRYIANQREHHSQRDFKGKLTKLLESHKIKFEERYVFD